LDKKVKPFKMKSAKRFGGSATVGVLFALGIQAYGVEYDFNYTGGDIVASGDFDVTGGTITDGKVMSLTVGGINEIPKLGDQLSFVTVPSLSATYVFTGGTDIFAMDNAFPIDGYGILFATTLTGQDANWGLNIWNNGAFGVLPDNIWDDTSGTLTVTAAPDGGLTAGLLGAALIGLGVLRRKLVH
jgi:hypothetical protein